MLWGDGCMDRHMQCKLIVLSGTIRINMIINDKIKLYSKDSGNTAVESRSYYLTLKNIAKTLHHNNQIFNCRVAL